MIPIQSQLVRNLGQLLTNFDELSRTCNRFLPIWSNLGQLGPNFTLTIVISCLSLAQKTLKIIVFVIGFCMFLTCRPSCKFGPTSGHFCASLEPTWSQLGPTWSQLGLNLSRLGGNLGQLGATLSQLGANLEPTWSQLGANLGQLGPT